MSNIKELNKCEYCGNNTNLDMGVITGCLPIPRMEEMIDRYGRGTWYKETEKDLSEISKEVEKELIELIVYDNLINTTKMGYCCNNCRVMETKLYDRYYPEVTGNVDMNEWSLVDWENRFTSYKDYLKSRLPKEQREKKLLEESRLNEIKDKGFRKMLGI